MFTRIFLTTACLIGLSSQLFAQRPSWLDAAGRKLLFPSDTFLLGFASEPLGVLTRDSLAKKLDVLARTDLNESVRVTIQSTTLLNIQNVNTQTSEYFKKVSQSYARVEVVGLQAERYFDDRKGIGYALVYAPKKAVRGWYVQRQAQLTAQLEQAVAAAQRAGKRDDMWKVWQNCRQLLGQLEEVHAVLFALDDYSTPNSAFLITQEQIVTDALARLEGAEAQTVDELATALIGQLTRQEWGVACRTSILATFTYAETGLGSAFSQKLHQLLLAKLAGSDKLKLAEEGGIELPCLSWEGSYWIESGKVRVTTRLRDRRDGMLLAGAEAVIAEAALMAENVSPYPPRPADPPAEFVNGEIINGGIAVEVLTQKGRNDLVFVKGERMKLFVRANQPCFLRFIYHQADGSRALLWDNYYLRPGQVGQLVPLPREFECVAPFGIEHLQINARSEPFTALRVQQLEGVRLLQEPLVEILRKTRAWDGEQGMTQGENRLMITTLPK